jgi:PKD repeat protein
MQFSATVTGDTPISYTWDFGGAGSQGGTDAYPTFTYDYTGTYTVTLVVDNGCTPTYTTTLQVEVHDVGFCDPVAIAELESDSPVELGQAMQFSATVTGDAPITYTWDFGGAGSQGGTDVYPTFTYDAAGDYDVTLDAANGCPSTDTQTIQVRVNPTGTICIPVDVTAVTESASDCVVDFVPTYTGDSPITWSWSFPGGTPSSSSAESPAGIDFGVSGTYAYTVTATNCESAQDVYTDTVTVSCGVGYQVYLPIVIKGN